MKSDGTQTRKRTKAGEQPKFVDIAMEARVEIQRVFESKQNRCQNIQIEVFENIQYIIEFFGYKEEQKEPEEEKKAGETESVINQENDDMLDQTSILNDDNDTSLYFEEKYGHIA